ncbi:MAG: succinylglutamate desuccinylase/aspartoacylase family protein [Asgard group archaeon]|nr:succinylglutamate desuccinylase/aspartoacylase family protein [Asgard group archaeon]
MPEIKIGEITSIPGKIVYDYLTVLEHPIGTIERLPIIIAQGKSAGPVLWLTANIHGNEYTGIPVIHKIINDLDLDELKGTIVAIPSLNPSGSRVKSRSPYYDRKDPNRLFPDGNPFKSRKDKDTSETSEIIVDSDTSVGKEEISIVSEKKVEIAVEKEIEKKEIDDPLTKYEEDELYPSVQELIFKKLFEHMKKSADVLIDLHNAYIKSIPFVFLDRVLYNPDKGERAKIEAEHLFDKTKKLVDAFGFTVVHETIPSKYIQKKLHRSTSGAALNALRIPSFTVELGMYLEIDPDIVDAAVIGVRNVMKSLDMTKGEIENVTGIPVIGQSEYVRYVGHPRLTTSAIIDLQVKAGDYVKVGDIIAYARDIFGRPLADVYEIKTEIDGYIFMINEGIVRYSNEELCWIASKDVKPMIDKWPKKQ